MLVLEGKNLGNSYLRTISDTFKSIIPPKIELPKLGTNATFIEASGGAFNKCWIWPLQNQGQLATLQVCCLVSYCFISNVIPEVS